MQSHPGVQLPATPAPRALDNQQLLADEGSQKVGSQRASGRSAKNAAKCGENRTIVSLSMNSSEALPGRRCMGAGTSTATQLWKFDGFLLSLHTGRRVNCWSLSLLFTRTSTATPCTCEISVFLHSLALCVPISASQLECPQSIDKRNLRHHLTADQEDLLELELNDRRDVHNRNQGAHHLSLAQYVFAALGWRWLPQGVSTGCNVCSTHIHQ